MNHDQNNRQNTHKKSKQREKKKEECYAGSGEEGKWNAINWRER